MTKPCELVGMSLSLCIKDILEGNIKEQDVVMIFAGTRITDKESLDHVCASYSQSYWSRAPESGVAIAYRLFYSNKILQERTLGFDKINMRNHRWIPYDQVEPLFEDFFTRVNQLLDKNED